MLAPLVAHRPGIQAVSMRHHRHAAVVHSLGFAMVARGMGLGSRGDLSVGYDGTAEAREKVVKIGELVQSIRVRVHLYEVQSATIHDTVVVAQDNSLYTGYIGQCIAVHPTGVLQLYVQYRT